MFSSSNPSSSSSSYPPLLHPFYVDDSHNDSNAFVVANSDGSMFDPSSSLGTTTHQAPLLFPAATNLNVADYAAMLQRDCSYYDYGGGASAGGVVGGHNGLNLLTKKGKKDRHSKIFTSQGLRDRRVRLSSEIARKFFDLQDMLEYDKPSNTLQWLFTKSENAIRELQRTKQANPTTCSHHDHHTFCFTCFSSSKDKRFPPPDSSDPHHHHHQLMDVELQDPNLLRTNFMSLEIPQHQEASFNNINNNNNHSPPNWNLYQ
ncbi:hypothetical protein HN51_007580 [Arachis hypogaea]|uniref:Transcription factor TCP3-like n=1 Tax=Arachis duranensis TaxID=130453 RepID=A0A6P5NMS4_ARADU|nr:transcription factor TCP3-like [Arachis duranensis]XP_025699743.1 transcription factor TCP3-like [Arachis hypogaea]QHO41738.1 Transcription factor CYCLOIDEA [Arachis hypogaea]